MAKPILYPYQQRWVEDSAPLKIALKARQIGFSFAMALEGVLLAIERPCNVLFLSASERQSRELMHKVYQHLRALNLLVGDLLQKARENSEECVLDVGGQMSRLISLPANPDTVRGFSGHIFLDEFAFHRDDRAIWRAIFPTIARGFRVRVASTPNGKQNLFYELWTHDDRFSKHRVDIHQAVADGLAVDVDLLRSGIHDPDAWAQEFECAFLDEATAFLPYDLLSGCEALDTLQDHHPSALRRSGPLYLGVDVGRKRDLTVMWLLQRLGDVLWTRQLRVLEGVPFRAQRDTLFDLLPHVERACIDATGLGMQLAEEAQDAFGRYRIEPVTFTAAVKDELAHDLRRLFEDRRLRIPADRAIREDLHSVRKLATAAGNIRFDAERTGDGHADRFWALALAAHAAAAPYQPVEYRTVIPRRFSESYVLPVGIWRDRPGWYDRRDRGVAY